MSYSVNTTTVRISTKPDHLSSSNNKSIDPRITYHVVHTFSHNKYFKNSCWTLCQRHEHYYGLPVHVSTNLLLEIHLYINENLLNESHATKYVPRFVSMYEYCVPSNAGQLSWYALQAFRSAATDKCCQKLFSAPTNKYFKHINLAANIHFDGLEQTNEEMSAKTPQKIRSYK